MIEQEEEEEEEEKETGIEFAATYLPHMPALVEGLVASLICLAEVGDLPGRPADCLILICRCLFTSVRRSNTYPCTTTVFLAALAALYLPLVSQ